MCYEGIEDRYLLDEEEIIKRHEEEMVERQEELAEELTKEIQAGIHPEEPCWEKDDWREKFVITWQSPHGEQLNICSFCAERQMFSGKWFKDFQGDEYYLVYRSLHRAICEACEEEDSEETLSLLFKESSILPKKPRIEDETLSVEDYTLADEDFIDRLFEGHLRKSKLNTALNSGEVEEKTILLDPRQLTDPTLPHPHFLFKRYRRRLKDPRRPPLQAGDFVYKPYIWNETEEIIYSDDGEYTITRTKNERVVTERGVMVKAHAVKGIWDTML